MRRIPNQLDQDYGGVLGNDFIKKHIKNCVSVFTYSDTLDNHPYANAEAWIEKSIAATKSPRFLVLGSSNKSQELEVTDLKKTLALSNNHSDFRFGAAELSTYLEECMIAQMDVQWPIALAFVRKELEACKERMEAIKERDPGEVVMRVCELIRFLMDDRQKILHDSLQELLETFRIDFQNIRLRNVKDEGASTCRKLEDGESVEHGTNIYFRSNPKSNSLSTGVVLAFNATTKQHEVRVGEDDVRWFAQQDLFSVEHSLHYLLPEIQQITKAHRGLRNPSHADPQIVIEYYAKDFSDRYGPLLKDQKAKLIEICKDLFSDDFTTKIEDHFPAASTVYKRLAEKIAHILSNVIEELDGRLDDLIAYNQPPLVFTTNNHYLDQTFIDLTGGNPLVGSTDEGSATIMYYRVRAYHKVQSKVILEAAAKCIVLHFQKFYDRVKGMLSESHNDVIKLVRDPPHIAEERAKLNRRISTLQTALDIARTSA
jgi:hypothetical protein